MSDAPKKKLCLAIHSLQAGGMERVMSELAAYFCKKPYLEVHLVMFGIKPELFYKTPDNLIIHKPPFVFDNRKRFWYTLKTMSYLRNLIRHISPFSVLCFGEYWNNFVLLSTLGLKYPIFVSDRSQPDKSLGFLHDKLRHWLYPRAKGLIFQTEKAKEIYLTNNKHHNTNVIGNPIRNFNNDNLPIKREKIVLMVGRLIKTKHQDKLIEMFAQVSLPDWKLMIVGYDHLKQHNMERLKSLAKELNIEQRVVFTGKQNNIEEIYYKSSIFAFTSSSEGFPNVIGEAMTAGLPAIAFDCVAGPSEMITDNHNGYLIPLYDYKLFQSKLSELMGDENLRKRLGANAMESIKKFSSDKICEAFYKFVTDFDTLKT
jgi:GalNAc-alpha-(1->4)-GalNAc-alpha-(1->3)-diNAcBac-PP-undecaprenol alpha-1,4-N-acetyl-D-galactosaminyltransferase